ncbi:MAG TPA: hypothetical protein VFD43_04880 [Planctomycetota bacterium]|nr:hypothetical protein [Planctomycetota bacterium]
MPAPRILDPPLVTVQFKHGAAPGYGDTATAEIAAQVPAGWAALESLFHGIRLLPLFTSVSPQAIEALMRRGQRLTRSYRPAPFLSMFHVKLPPRSEWDPSVPTGHGVAEELKRLMLLHLPIDRVSVLLVLPPPPSTTQISDGPVTATAEELHHLHESPKSIGVEKVWGEPGGQGEGEVFGIVERGWRTEHADFLGIDSADDLVTTVLPTGDRDDAEVDHGTSSLGVVASRENEKYSIGVAPLAAEAVLASEWHAKADAAIPEDAILAVLDVLITKPPGSVLLLEISQPIDPTDLSPKDFGPAEMRREVFDAIQLAVANAVIVVEPAGNAGGGGAAGIDLGAAKLLEDVDSGAIMVGQSVWSPSYDKDADASDAKHVAVDPGVTGSRIDCFAWGDRVFAPSAKQTSAATSSAAAEFEDYFDPYFGGASSASAMIAGVAIVVQGLYRHATGGYLSPAQMRLLLRDRTVGVHTHLGSGETDLIGVMPDLAMLEPMLGELVDLYIRDNVDDDGTEHDGLLCCSPDIIVKTSPLPAGTSAQDAFGAGSHTELDADLSDPPIHGSKAYVYVRVSNRGGKNAYNATVKVYWSESSTLQQPSVWLANLIGKATINVPQGSKLVVAGPIEWTTVPEPEHYCFIATVEHAEDPRFIPENFSEWEYFKNFVRVGNNVAWRNFDVIEMPTAADIKPLSADVTGPDEEDGKGGGEDPEMELRIEANLPRDATVELELPAGLAGRLHRRARAGIALRPLGSAARRKRRRGQLQSIRVAELGTVRLKRKERHRVTLHVKIPKAKRTRAYEIALIQLHAGTPVGRVTWRLVPKRRR